MVVKDHLSAMMNDLMNCKRAKKKEVIIMPVTKLILQVLKIMKEHGYLDFRIEEEKFKKIIIKIEKINECGSVKPRFYVKKGEIYKYIKRYLPARNFGILIVSTNKGLMTHYEAIEKGVGGSLIAYCF